MVKSKTSMSASSGDVKFDIRDLFKAPYGSDWPLDGSHEPTRDEVESLVDDWCGTGYRAFRRAFNGDPSAREIDVRRVMTFDRWLDGGSYSGEIHRGINVKDEILSEFRVGAVIDQLGPSSWSADAATADNFSSWNDYNRVVLHMDGTSHGRKVWDIPGNGGEREVTVSSQSTQRITARRKRKNGIIDIYLEEV